jgi:tetratricopeptide (TPR) repeat protein/O-antigen ligase
MENSLICAIKKNKYLFPALFCLMLGLCAMLWSSQLRHGTYIRQVLLTALFAPLAFVMGLLICGPSWIRIKACFSSWPARFFLLGLVGHCGFAWTSLAWTSNTQATLDRAIVLTSCALWAIGWLIAATPGKKRPWLKYAGVHLVVLLGIGVLGCVSHVWNMGLEVLNGRLGEPIGNCNTVAVLMMLGFLIGACWLIVAIRKRGLWPFPGLFLVWGLLAVALSFIFAWSRSGFVGIVFGLSVSLFLVLVLVLRRKGLARQWILLGCGGLIIAGSILIYSGVIRYAQEPRRSRILEKVKLSSIGARYYGTVAGLNMMSDRPLTGKGAGTFFVEVAGHLPRERYLGSYGHAFLNIAHNEYAETVGELGLIGLVFFLLVLLSSFFGSLSSAIRHWPTDVGIINIGICGALAGVIVTNIADPSFRFWDFTGVFYALAALAVAGSNSERFVASSEVSENETGSLIVAERKLRIKRLLVVFLGLLLVSTATLGWSYKDLMREHKLLMAIRLKNKALRLLASAEAAARNDDKVVRDQAPLLRSAALEHHNRSSQDFMIAARTRGYFLSRVYAQIDWVGQRLSCVRAFTGTEAKREFLRNECISSLEEMVDMLPGNPQMLRHLAEGRRQLGDLKEAVAALTLAARRDPYTNIAVGSFNSLFSGDVDRCLKAVEGSRELLKHQGDGKCSLCSLKSVGSGVSSRLMHDLEIMTLRSLAFGNCGNWQRARDEISGINNPGLVKIIPLGLWQCFIFRQLKDFDRAVRVGQLNVLREPMHAMGFFQLALALQQRGAQNDPQLAVGSLKRCIQLDVEQEEAKFELTSLLKKLHRTREALAVALDALKIARNKERFFLRGIDLHIILKQYGAAAALARRGRRVVGSAMMIKVAAELNPDK